MNHPIVSEFRIFKLYALIWLIVCTVHATINVIIYELPIELAIIDSLTFNVLMFFLGLSIWFPIVYSDRTKGQLNVVMQIVLVGIIIVFIWLFLGYQFLELIFSEDIINQLFDRNGLIIRATVGGLIFMIFVMIYYMFNFYNELEEKNRQHESMNRLLRETELNALKSQLNPHFLFNSLNSVSSLTISEPDAARTMINKLSEFMRYSLRKNEDALLSLREELKNIARYLEIEKVRFGDRLLCELDIPDECKDMKVPVLILQPIFENAIKHGVYESIEPVKIRTFCRMVDNSLEISIINNFEEGAAQQKGAGVGLANVRNRLQLIYNRNDLLTINQENHYFEVIIRLPQLSN
ncbi:histidine kinase [Carboxylicivirga sp. A043]|uniref:sensor histidine kinase n=1 Tax=Carboxylicivirga litoralis TaxID=2816963 RepID=UPI0021CB5402|nr:histidine kinase [Carboxylicivirga sp. A043]MCU4155137.1 histidine kinase [Carboxylicivirga sp. A043]